MQGGEFVPVASHGGINFFIGNNKDADGWYEIPSGTGLKEDKTSHIKVAERNVGRKLKLSEVSNYWYMQGLKFIIHNPGQYIGLLGKKLIKTWNAYERPDVFNYYFNKEYSFSLRYLTVGFGLIGPLSLLGMALSLPHRRKLGWLFIFIVAYLLSLMLFFINSRYRLPIVPALIPFAAYGIFVLYGSVLKRQWQETAVYGVMILVLAGLINSPYSGKERDMAHYYYLLGNNASQSGKLDDAIRYFEKATSVGTSAFYFNNLGVAYKNKGLYEKAIKAYNTAISLDPRHERSYLNLGVVLRKLGKFDEAEKTYRKAIKLNPDYVKAYHNLGNLYVDMGRINEAIASYKKAIELNPLFIGSYFQLAQQYQMMGLFDEEAKTLETLISVTKGKVKPSVYEKLWKYYTDISPDPYKAELYRIKYDDTINP
jgi:Tfp pilus assembly protein PilF